jgi:Domain of unknown function (DUF4389)
MATATYPVHLSVDYDAGPRNRLTVLLRPLVAIPVVIVLGALGSSNSGGATGAGVLFLATALMLVFRHKYPGWWYEWNVNLIRFANRVFAYVFLLRDEYPATDEEQHVHVTLPDPQGGGVLNRWMPLVKWFLAIPHLVVLVVMWIAAVLATIASWFVILVTGRQPQSLHLFVVGVFRWTLRVQAYAFALVTDSYPPFRLAD